MQSFANKLCITKHVINTFPSNTAITMSFVSNEAFPSVQRRIIISVLGTTIGAYSGRGTLNNCCL